MLKNDVVNYLLNKVVFDIPDEFLKKWLVHTSENNQLLQNKLNLNMICIQNL